MEYRLLGPFEVRDGDAPIDLGARKPQMLLAALALRAGHVVGRDALVEELFGDQLPSNPRATINTYVARVRLALGGDESRLERVDQGYRLNVAPGEVDVERFERLVDDGRGALGAGDPATATARLRQALLLWRGPLLDGLLDSDLARTESARLEELRLTATEDRIDAELALGRHEDLVGELTVVANTYPTREGVWSRLALALYRSGRQAEALARCRELAQNLRVTFGLEPSPALQDLERRMLDQDRALEEIAIAATTRPAAAGSTGRSAASLPRALRLGGPLDVPIIGRDRELAALDRLVAHAAAGANGIAVVSGEPGIGKTRLVAEAVARADAAGAVTFAGRADAEALLPYQPVVEILNAALDAAGPAALDAAGGFAAELGRILPDLGLRFPHLGPPSDAPPEAVPYLVQQAVTRVLTTAAASAPLVLVVDDLQWADDPTLRLLHALVSGGELGLCLLTTLRTEAAAAMTGTLADLARAAPLTEIPLAGLDVDDVAALVASRLPDRAPWLARSVHELTAGNPFFVLELARHLADRPQGAPVDGTDLPGSVVNVVQQRIDRLGPVARAALSVAALAGSEFDVEVVAAACEEPGAGAALRAAEAAGLVRATDDAGRACFAHAIVRSVVAANLSTVERRATHTRLAAAIARSAPPGRPPHGQLAYHYGRAGARFTPAAVEHSLLAARDAAARHAHEDVLRHCETGLEALARDERDDPRALELLLLAARAYGGMGLIRPARDQALAAVDLARRLGDGTTFASGVLAALPVSPDLAIAPLVEEALARRDVPDDLRPPLLAALALSVVEVDPEQADTAIAAACASLGEEPDAATVHRILMFETQYGDDVSPRDRFATATLLLDLLSAEGRRDHMLDAYSCRARAAFELGDVAAVRADFAAHERLATELHEPGSLAVVEQRRAMWALLAGRFRDAEAHVHEAMLHVSDDPAWVSVYGGQLVAIRLESGRFGEALGLMDAALADEDERPVMRTTRALLTALLGDHDGARPAVRELATAAPGWRRDMFWSIAVANLADAAVALGDGDAAEIAHALLLPYADRVGVFAFGAACWGSMSRFLAPLEILLDRPDDAAAHYEQAIAVHEDLGAVTFLARDRLGYASVLAERGPRDRARARRLVQDATRTLHELGLAHLVPGMEAATAG